jgi:hypothetical protein
VFRVFIWKHNLFVYIYNIKLNAMNKSLIAIKGYATEENVVFLQGDMVEVTSFGEEGMVYLLGVSGWCNGTEMNFIPKVVAECFASVEDW